jgi:hypothetical protein
MRAIRLGLRLWMSLGSILSFAAGWILLAHAPKPVQPVATPSSMAAPVPTLAPLPSLNFGANNSGPAPQSLQFQNPPVVIQQPNPSVFFPPVFRTGGS